MKLNTPLPQHLPKECAKAARIFRSFVDSSNNGLDGVIPRSVLENAKGFAIFTVIKAGFVFSARGGTGVVIARLDDGSWSAPSAIGTAGVGFGGQAGAEMTDFLIVLNTRSALRTFMTAGSITLGGNLSIAIGPLGRNGEASGALNTRGKMAAMYSYSKTRGLFGGVSLEGSVIAERQDCNVEAYRSPVNAKLLLGGFVEPPIWATPLIQTLESCTSITGRRAWIQEGVADGTYSFNGIASPSDSLRTRHNSSAYPPPSWGQQKDSGSYFSSEEDLPPTFSTGSFRNRSSHGYTDYENDYDPEYNSISNSGSYSSRQSRFNPSRSTNGYANGYGSPPPVENPFASPRARPLNLSSSTGTSTGSSLGLATSLSRRPSARYIEPVATGMDLNDDIYPVTPEEIHETTISKVKAELSKPLTGGIGRAVALYNFKAVESGDLSFSKGDVIIILKKSDSINDWWTGKIANRQGIFPANFVEVV